ncbi:MAG: glucose sorbosone dehydrogenase [Rhodothermales bacterium]|nr:glucose sorbosone dehydrogenase [Rhodothermales bacterium]
MLGLPVTQSSFGQEGDVTIEAVSPTFNIPVSVRSAGDGSGRLFVIEQRTALVRWFIDEPNSQASTFLDLSAKVDTFGFEEGLLGLVFHPDYVNNGYFYVNYTAANPERSVIERYQVSAGDPDVADPNSGLVILEIDQPEKRHNGGDLAFGPDGFLYSSFGDGGDRPSAQDRSNLLGTLIRIDVDQTQGGLNYAIPTTNPFFGNTDGHREEIWAYGFRNPWRFSFAPDSSIWVGDVGENTWEEVDIVEKGKNYGWPIMEGSECFDGGPCDMTGLELPFYEYPRIDGRSITGGYVYRGSSSSLQGQYIYSDFNKPFVFALDFSGATIQRSIVVPATTRGVGFGEDEDGELYVALFSGEVGKVIELLGIDVEANDPVDGPSTSFVLHEAYPNPSSGRFWLPVEATRPGQLQAFITDHLGRLVQTIETPLTEGRQDVAIDLRSSAVGTYLVRIDVPGESLYSMLSVIR